MSVQFEEKANNNTIEDARDVVQTPVGEDKDKGRGRGNGSDIMLAPQADGVNAKFSVIEIKFFRKFGLSEQDELLSSWDCRLDLYVPRNGKLFLSRHPTQSGHICFSSCKLNKSNVKRCIPLAEVVHMEKKEATITNLKYYGVRGICFHFSDGTLLQFSRFEDRDGAWDTIREEWERARTITGNDKLQRQNQLQEEEANRKKKKKKKEVVCTNPPIKKKNKKKKKEVVPSASSCGLLMLTILEARNLPRTYMSHVGFVEPCCTLSFGTQTFQTEAAGRNKGTCKWNEKFNIAVYSHEEATTLELTIDDGENRIIGTYQAPIMDFLEPLTPIDKWIVLETQQSKGFYFDAQAQFQVHIRSEFKAKEEIQHIFWKECVSVFDSDNDGKVDFTEAMSMLKVLGCGLPEDEINELYHVIDVNNDGAISPDDLVRFSASGSGGLISLLVKRCPLCGYHLSTVEEEAIYHLGVCVFDDISKNLLVRMMVVPLGSVLRMSKKKLKKGKKAPSFLVMDRQTGKLIPEIIPQRVRVLMKTVYGNKIGKKVMLTNRAIRLLERASINQGMKFDHPSSVKDIDIFMRYYKIDTNELADPLESFGCFNEFFYRKLRAGARPVSSPDDPEVCVSAADARLMVFNNVSEATRLWIKGRNFSIESLLDDEQLAETFKGGSIAVYRLAPQDYHRFHMPVDGQLGAPRNIAGNYHTVNPLAINSQVLNVFTENKRTITLIDSPQFGTVAYIAIGATLVGSIIHTCDEGDTLKRGDEVGYFAFGGSTIITLFTKGAIKFDDDLLLNSAQPLETLVRMGERVGRKRRPEDKDGYDLMYDDNGLSPMEGDESDAIGTEGEDDLLGGMLNVSVSGSGGKDTINRASPDYTATLLDDGMPAQLRTPGGEKKNFATKTKNTLMLGTKLISPKKFKGKKNSSRDDSADIGGAIANATKEGSVSPPTQRRDRKRDKRDMVHQSNGGGSSNNGGKRGSRIWRRKDSNDNNKKYAGGKKEGSADMYLAGPPFSRSLSAVHHSSSASGSSSPAGLTSSAHFPHHHSHSSFYGHSSTSSSTSLAASHNQSAEHHHHHHLLHHQQQQHHHQQRQHQHRFILPLSMINANSAPSLLEHTPTSSPPRSPRSPPSYPQTTPTGSPAHTPRPSTHPEHQPISSSPGDVYVPSAFIPPSPFYPAPLSSSPYGTPTTDRMASLSLSREQRRHAQEEIEAVEMYELSAAYAIEGFVFDHIGGPVRSSHHHHASRYGEGDDEDDGVELDHAIRSRVAATDNMWSKGKEISSDTPQQPRRCKLGKSADDAKPGGLHVQPSAELARTDGYRSTSSSSPVVKNRIHHNDTVTTSSAEGDVKAKHKKHHHHHRQKAHQQDEMMVLTEDEDKGRSADERFGGGLDEDDDHHHHHHYSRDHKRPQQVYPPPGHPYLYQLAPYTFDLDDCFEDEYDEVDDQMFGELKRELELEQLHASGEGEVEC